MSQSYLSANSQNSIPNSYQPRDHPSRGSRQLETSTTNNNNDSLFRIEHKVQRLNTGLGNIHNQILEQMDALKRDQDDFRSAGNELVQDLSYNKNRFEQIRLQRREQINKRFEESSIDQLLDLPEFERLKHVKESRLKQPAFGPPIDESQYSASPLLQLHKISNYEAVPESEHEEMHEPQHRETHESQHEEAYEPQQQQQQSQEQAIIPNHSLVKSKYDEMALDSELIMESDVFSKDGGNDFSAFKASKFSNLKIGSEAESQLLQNKKYTENQMDEVNKLLSLSKNNESMQVDEKVSQSILLDEKNLDNYDKLDQLEQKADELLKQYEDVQSQPGEQEEQASMEGQENSTIHNLKQQQSSNEIQSMINEAQQNH